MEEESARDERALQDDLVVNASHMLMKAAQATGSPNTPSG